MPLLGIRVTEQTDSAYGGINTIVVGEIVLVGASAVERRPPLQLLRVAFRFRPLKTWNQHLGPRLMSTPDI